MQKYWGIQTNIVDNPNQAEHTISKEANANSEEYQSYSGSQLKKVETKTERKKRETNGMVISECIPHSEELKSSG